MINVMITDDHPVVRQGIKKILEGYSDISVTGEAGSANELMEILHKKDFNIVLLDISLPGKNGLEILRDIITEKPSLPVLMLSIHPEEQYALRALKLGAAGYLTKSSVPEELVNAVRKVALGKKYISMELAEKIADEIHKGQPLHSGLSNREMDVMCLLAEGNSPNDIAVKLSLSIKTVSTYRSRILEKLNMKSTSEIIRYAIKEGLVT